MPAHVARWYKIYWNKVYIADLKVEVGQGSIISQIESIGFVKTVSNYANHSYGKFKEENGVYKQNYFESHLQQRQGSKETKIYYSADQRITTEILTPPDSKGKRPKVAEDLKNGAANPLFSAILARQKIKESLADGSSKFSFRSYDGRRLSNLEFKILGKETIKTLDKNIDVVKISFRRIPVAGFNHKELNRMKGEEPDFTIYLEQDTLLPLKADATAPLGQAKFILEKECGNIQECS